MSAIIEGEEDPEKLAAFDRRTLKKKKEELELALRGNMSAHQRIMLNTMLTHVDFLNEQILELDTEVAKRLDPFQQDIERLDTIPCIGRRTAEQLLAEVETDVASALPFRRSSRHWLRSPTPYADLTITWEPSTGASPHEKADTGQL